MNKHEQFQLIDKFLRHSISEKESEQLQSLRKDPDFEDTFLLMLELRSALRHIKMSEKMAYIKHLELSLTLNSDKNPTLSASLKEMINRINTKFQLFFVCYGLKLNFG